MSKVEEIEQAVEQLSIDEFAKLAAWVEQRGRILALSRDTAEKSPSPVRDHSAFLNSYSPEDDGLYDDGAAR
ncbi:MAG TPA: hypothetical protein VM260_26810 [Pirellula sp.]|jgi:hypothetical protein|nr:hypothetical protein [Pirellula sp.]